MKFSAPQPSLCSQLSRSLAGCGGSGGSSSSPGREGLRQRRLRQLPHAQGGGREGPGRAESRRAEARRVDRRASGARGRQRHALVRQQALARADRAGGVDFVADASRSSGTSAAFKPDKTTVRELRARAASPFCFRQAFANIAYSEGPEKALALLGDGRLAHPGGSRRLPPDLARGRPRGRWPTSRTTRPGARPRGDDLQLGLLPRRDRAGVRRRPAEEVVGSRGGSAARPAVHTEEFLLYQCVHGLGHGLMIYSGLDLPWSLQTCDRLQTDFDRVSCTGGVFMQNLDTEHGHLALPAPKDPIYPCNAVAERHKVYCYLMVTSRILTPRRLRLAQDGGLVPAEREGLGCDVLPVVRTRRVGLQPVPAAARRSALCLEAGDDAGDCLYGAARDYGNNYAGGAEAARLCNLAPRGPARPLLRGHRHDPRHAAPLRERAASRPARPSRRPVTDPTATAAQRSPSMLTGLAARASLWNRRRKLALFLDDAAPRAGDDRRRRRRRRHRLRHRARCRVEPQFLRGAVSVARADHGRERRAAAELRAQEFPSVSCVTASGTDLPVRGRRLRHRLFERGRRARRRP